MVGRTAAAVFGLALILALVFGVATMALAAVPGDPFMLGQSNTINVITKLTGRVAGPNLQITNNSNDSRATGLSLQTPDRIQPLKVLNPDAGKFRNLDADKLDGLDSSELKARATPTYTVVERLDGMANQVVGGSVACDSGDEVLARGYVALSSGTQVDTSIPQTPAE